VHPAIVRFVTNISPLTYWRLRVLQATWKVLFDPTLAYSRSCGMCGYHGPMAPYGYPFMWTGPHCPSCRSQPRHRLLSLWASRNEERIRGKAVLHFAPETLIEKAIRPLAQTYVTADAREGAGDLVLDIENIDQPSASFDIVIASHVLEHVDDHAALKEIHRILRPKGFALLLFPVVDSWPETYEPPGAKDFTAGQKLLHFGSTEHVRFYGADVVDRITQAGFLVSTFVATEPDVRKFGLARGETLYIATRES
jgi:SAM-dependent methyltransferase